jgi:colicin import membrane protein
MARLKVFITQSGFYDLAVAVPSQAAALRAWGIHQNLFADGMAKVATDKAVVEAAMAKPGVVLKRPLGTHGAFAQEAPLPKVKVAKARPKARENGAARKAVAVADEALERAEQDHADTQQGLERKQAELAAKLKAEERAWAARRRALEQTGNRARRALRKAR